jgi:LPXTG-motif cell wall-anchored protein
MARISIAVFLVVVVGATLLSAGTALADPPANDVFADSVVIDPAELPFADSVDTTEATSDDDDTISGCEAPATDASVWYSITPTTDLVLVVSGDGTDYSYGIAVVTGDSGSLELIDCRPGEFLIEAQANVTYHFQVLDDQVDGGGNGGSLEFTLRESTAAETAQAADAPNDPFVIETQLTFHETAPPSGTFDVLADSEVLGCSTGSFIDPDAEDIEGGLAEVTKLFTCESGPKTGTFSVLFIPGQDVNEADHQTGPWEVEEGTGDFAGLVGGGDFSVVFDSPTTGVETLAGTIEFSGAEDELAETGSETGIIAAMGLGAILIGLILVLNRRSLNPR